MAVAEARAAWQRTANRCFVQEDAKIAPKFACYPSVSPSSKQVDAGPTSAADGQDTPIAGFFPLNRNPSFSNLPPDSKWWLWLQPNHGYQRCFADEHLNIMEGEMEVFTDGHRQKLDEDTPVNGNTNVEPSLDTHCWFSATCMKKDSGVGKQVLKSVYTKKLQDPLKLEDSEELYELVDMDPVECFVSKQYKDHCIDSASPWIEGEKSEPWWRIADGDELALLVAQRSLDLIENCDLPHPQNTYVKKEHAHVRCFNDDGIFDSSGDWKSQSDDRSNLALTQGNLCSGIPCGKQWARVEVHSQSATDEPVSECRVRRAVNETQISDDGDASKAQLLEALRHSQTRAREAEKAAKQAYAEKEHIVKLFFRQASHLFAYKQWFQLLQLENLYFQIRNTKNQPISTLFPVLLPWVPYRIRKPGKSWQKTAKGKRAKRGHPRCDPNRLAVVFALGLGLVGAGLLLGWTVGWMLPAF